MLFGETSERKLTHVHVFCENGEAKFWLKPEIELAKNYRLSRSQLKEVEKIIEEHYHEFTAAWQTHFRS